mmetsp:Transcript_739/g.2012  ORF Transcript_739/g.2012 Transcript_739/m.2012 type:complete len:287 (-) Transcript_739:100-960(-)
MRSDQGAHAVGRPPRRRGQARQAALHRPLRRLLPHPCPGGHVGVLRWRDSCDPARGARQPWRADDVRHRQKVDRLVHRRQPPLPPGVRHLLRFRRVALLDARGRRQVAHHVADRPSRRHAAVQRHVRLLEEGGGVRGSYGPLQGLHARLAPPRPVAARFLVLVRAAAHPLRHRRLQVNLKPAGGHHTAVTGAAQRRLSLPSPRVLSPHPHPLPPYSCQDWASPSHSWRRSWPPCIRARWCVFVACARAGLGLQRPTAQAHCAAFRAARVGTSGPRPWQPGSAMGWV